MTWGIRWWVLKYAPTFCWCTALDLYRMAEQAYPLLTEESFAQTLSRLKREGHFITKPYGGSPYPNPAGYAAKTTTSRALLYLRREDKE